MGNAITDVAGLLVGHSTNLEAATGCTVVLCPQGAVAGVDVRGSAPGTRETDLLRPGNLVQQVHAVMLSGGSAYGLDAASGVMRYLEERDIGYRIGPGVVPIVPAAIIFDLGLVTHSVRPGPDDGYAACVSASDGPPEEGSVGRRHRRHRRQDDGPGARHQGEAWALRASTWTGLSSARWLW